MSTHKIGTGSVIPFPCWLYYRSEDYGSWEWYNEVPYMHQRFTHYSTNPPDQPPLGEPAPEGSLPVTTGKLPDVAAKTLEVLEAQDELSSLSNWALVHRVLETDHADSLAVIELMNRVYPGWEMHDAEPAPTPPAPSLQSVAEGANEQTKFVESMCDKLGGVGLVSCFKGILTRHFAPLLTERDERIEALKRDRDSWHDCVKHFDRALCAMAEDGTIELGRSHAATALAMGDIITALRTRCEELEAALKPFAEMAKYRDFPFHGQMQAMQANPSTAAEPGFQLFYADFYRAADTLDKRAARKEGQQST